MLHAKKINFFCQSFYPDKSTNISSCIYAQVTSEDWLNFVTYESFLTGATLYPHIILLLDKGLPSIGGTAKEEIHNIIVFIVSVTVLCW